VRPLGAHLEVQVEKSGDQRGATQDVVRDHPGAQLGPKLPIFHRAGEEALQQYSAESDDDESGEEGTVSALNVTLHC